MLLFVCDKAVQTYFPVNLSSIRRCPGLILNNATNCKIFPTTYTIVAETIPTYTSQRADKQTVWKCVIQAILIKHVQGVFR